MLLRLVLGGVGAGNLLRNCGKGVSYAARRQVTWISHLKQVKQSGSQLNGSICNKHFIIGAQGFRKIASQFCQHVRHKATSATNATSGSSASAATRAFPDISEHAQKVVGRWLLLCSGMVVVAVALGGATRLTESGLSITEWDLVTGIKPPLTAAEWKEKFDTYKQFPEYKYLKREMTMTEFKSIFLMEWFHRIWGRAVGLAFILPAAYFWRKGYLSRKMKPRMFVYGGLIMLQGVLGIIMVRSGLKEKSDPTEVPRVSQYMLCTHFGTAVFLYVLMFWQALSHVLPPNQLQWTRRVALMSKVSHGAMGLVFLTALSGAFVAGLDAGLVYNTWPKFADRWIPSDILAFSPTWRNFFENHTTVQFNHRHLGEFTGLVILALWLMSLRTPLPRRARLASHAVLALAFVQIGLGISTLLSFVPTSLAVSHQTGSLTLLSAALWLTHELRRLPK